MSTDITIIIKDRKIKICQNVIDVFYDYIQSDIFLRESGGILIGKENRSNTNIIIKYITTPMTNDKCKRFEFLRIDKAHLEMFKKLYNSSRHTLRYIGEWHTHSEKIPHFSKKDLNNWRKICIESNNDKDYYHVIVGQNAVRMWMIDKDNDSVELICTILWKDMIKS